MNIKITKMIIYMITMSIIYVIISNLNNKKQILLNNENEQDIYIVKAPSALKGVSFVIFCVGWIAFFVFLIFKLKNSSTVTYGHFIFASVFASIGLAGMILSTTWRIEVNRTDMIIHRLCRFKIEIQMSEVERIEVGKKGEMMLYVDGKKITTIDPFSENYDVLKRNLEKYVNN